MVQSMDSTVEKSSGCICGSHNQPSMLVQQQHEYDTISNPFTRVGKSGASIWLG